MDPVESGLLKLYEPEGLSNLGHGLETKVLLQLQCEMDLHGRFLDGQREPRALLILLNSRHPQRM